ncbi:hypothetical protein O1L55_09665 [Streptomyces albulus]|nr:hypothetical protein [Streptomyces noursei]
MPQLRRGRRRLRTGEGPARSCSKLSAAERDGDRILAVLRGSAVNHGGASKGYSVPSPGRRAS